MIVEVLEQCKTDNMLLNSTIIFEGEDSLYMLLNYIS